VLAWFLLWTHSCGARTDCGAIDIGRGETAITDVNPPSWWAMISTLSAYSPHIASLVIGVLFLWVSAPNWPPAQIAEISLAISLAKGVALALPAACGFITTWTARRGSSPVLWLALAAIGQAGALAGLSYLGFELPDPEAHAQYASALVVVLYIVLHAGLGLVMALWAIFRWYDGYIGAGRVVDQRIGSLCIAATRHGRRRARSDPRRHLAGRAVTWLDEERPTAPW
jgi:cytochrome c oxidase subunit I+III